MQSVDGCTLGAFRICFGSLMFYELFGSRSQIDSEYLATKCPFRYDGFDWLPTPSEPAFEMLLWIMAAAAFLLSLGLCYRAAAVVWFASYTYIFLLEQTLYNNHYYLIALLSLLFAVSNANSSLSLKNIVSANHRDGIVPRWNLLLFQSQMVIVYFYAGVAKLNGDWLRGEPVRHILRQRSADSPVNGLLDSELAVYFVAYGGLLFDLAIGFLLWSRRTRLLAVVLVVSFHLTNNWLFTIGVFPWLGICATVLFFDPATARKLLAKMTGQLGMRQPPKPERSARKNFNSRWSSIVTIGAILYVALQLSVPLRHFFIPSNVSWNEEGHNFAWHMKLRAKDGIYRFYLLYTDGRLEPVLHRITSPTGNNVKSPRAPGYYNDLRNIWRRTRVARRPWKFMSSRSRR